MICQQTDATEDTAIIHQLMVIFPHLYLREWYFRGGSISFLFIFFF